MKKGQQNTLMRIIPPPLVVLGLSIIGLGLHWYHQLPFQNGLRTYWLIGGSALMVFSGSVAFCARRVMRAQKTPITFSEPTVVIVRKGPFAISRNPLYLSLLMLYAGMGIAANSLWFAPLFLVLFLFLHRVILREELYLEHAFGQEYLLYKNTARRWF